MPIDRRSKKLFSTMSSEKMTYNLDLAVASVEVVLSSKNFAKNKLPNKMETYS
jgi:hypothetical protein